MRPEWLKIEGKIIGISLGADFCAEHEWGINDTKRRLGVDGSKDRYSREKAVYTKPPGLPRRMISKHDSVRLYECEKAAALICNDRFWFERFQKYVAEHGVKKAFKEGLPQDLRGGGELRTAWSDGDFGIYAEGENVEHLRALWNAFQADGVAIWIGGRAIALENGGLVLCIADRIPAAQTQMLLDTDIDSERLQKASDATGIIERLEVGKKGYYACSPRWQGNKPRGKHPVIYWLNPTEQQENNYGWFTVEELDQWIAGTGPVPMAKVTK